MPVYLVVFAAFGIISTGAIAVIGASMFMDSWAEGEKGTTISGAIFFFVGLMSLLAVVAPMLYIADHLKGVQ